MTFNDYLLNQLSQTVMITLSTGHDIFQYNYWNWLSNGQFHLLNDDYTIGHILHDGTISQNEDGSLVFSAHYHPCKLILNFYFGKASK
jgi:hypothetical protein